MKKIYLKPEMELTECIMLRTGVCSTPVVINDKPDKPSTPEHQAPVRNVF